LLPRIVARIVQAHNGQHTALVHEKLIARSHHRVPLVEPMIQWPRRIIGQALRSQIIFSSLLASLRGTMFEILADLGGAITDFVGKAIDVFGSFPAIQHSSHAK
jgi:hypothetical protein